VSYSIHGDWGEASEAFDEIKSSVAESNLSKANEAQTRFDVIDRIIRDVLSWQHGQIFVEEPNTGPKTGYVDYILRHGDNTLIVEAKRAGAAFPSPTRRPKLKLSGSILGEGQISDALAQAEEYAISKKANVVVVTNGLCWCFYSLTDKKDDSYASLLFPFTAPGHAEQLFDIFAVSQVETGSLSRITNKLPPVEDRLIWAFKSIDGRVDRNNVADHIMPALNQALYADALLSNPEHLKRCYVATEARIKFDVGLRMHLMDPKPESIKPAPRIKRDNEHGHLERIVESSISSHAPPVTLIIGPVGVGKTTYLRHFEIISGSEILKKKMAHWVYIDFEEMGKLGNPRQFIYSKLKEYLLEEHPHNPTTYRNVVEPAYASEIAALARGPYAPLYHSNKEEFNNKIVDYIEKDFIAVEPYVDKVMRHITKSQLCVIVLDNVDLYEDEILETYVFSEGLALSKRIFCNVIVSIRDSTFVKHHTNATFNAYELRKLWLDPPPFKAVLSSRLTYARKILKDRSAKIALANGMQLEVPDLSIFFEIVQRSILHEEAGDYIESVADPNIRRGLTLVTNFLTSGHINGDRAIRKYLEGQRNYQFPYHEIFKGTMLAQWRHFREDRSEGVNIFDARLGSRRTRLLRLLVLNFFLTRAQHEETLETPLIDCIQLFTKCGASEHQVISCISFLAKKGLIRNTSAEEMNQGASAVLTRSGGFYSRVLCHKHIYVEECMFDTAIDDPVIWQTLSDLTTAIEGESSILARWELRKERTDHFTNYLCRLETEMLGLLGNPDYLGTAASIRDSALTDADRAIASSKRRYRN
jgi:hypothetical protein